MKRLTSCLRDDVWLEKQADFDLQQLYCYDKLKNLSWIACSIGTLGGGNHFIEVDKTMMADIISHPYRKPEPGKTGGGDLSAHGR